MEYNTTGMFLSTNPLKKHINFFLTYCIASEKELENAKVLGDGKFGGVLIGVKEFTTKKLKKMGKIQIETVIGTIEFVVFPRQWEEYGWFLKVGKPVIIKGAPQEGREWILNFIKELEE